MKYLITVLVCLCTASSIKAQSTDDMMAKESFLILHSAKSYAAALETARAAASGLHLKLDLRGLEPHSTAGLTMSPAECDSNGFDYPAYVARGRYDGGEYLSIEHSNEYEGFAKGYYIVIAASGAAEDATMKAALLKARRLYPQAYLKTTKVYMGCMH